MRCDFGKVWVKKVYVTRTFTEVIVIVVFLKYAYNCITIILASIDY